MPASRGKVSFSSFPLKFSLRREMKWWMKY